MNRVHKGHEGHSVGVRHSGWYCDSCDHPVEHAPDICLDCYGYGWKRRMTSIYNPQPGKKYRCGKCKGTGKQKPTPCVTCGAPSTIYTSKLDPNPHSRATHHCLDCYTKASIQ